MSKVAGVIVPDRRDEETAVVSWRVLLQNPLFHFIGQLGELGRWSKKKKKKKKEEEEEEEEEIK